MWHKMGKRTVVGNVAAILSGMVACACCAAAMAEENRIVADPYRAVGVKWPKYFMKGQDYRFMLYPSFFALSKEPLLANEPFMKDAGRNSLRVREEFVGGGRTLSLREVICRDAAGDMLAVRSSLTSPDKDGTVQNPAALTDGKKGTYAVVSAPICRPVDKFTPVHATASLEADAPIASIEIISADDPGLQVAEAKVTGVVASCTGEGAERRLTLSAPAKAVSLELSGAESRYVIGDIKVPDDVRRHLAQVPFMINTPGRGIFGLRPECVDSTGLDNLARDYPDTYLGCGFGEWDAMFFYRLGRPWAERLDELATIGKFPCNRDEMIRNMKAFWDLAYSQKKPKMFGLGAAGFESYACEWGSTLCSAEFTDNRERPFRNTMMRMRGASRQFGVPIYVYTAYYRGQYTCDTRPELNISTNGKFGEDFGREPSLALREHYMTYYMGNNFQSFECQPWGQLKRLQDGALAYTKDGLAMKDVYDWYKSPQGERGESYAPILLLTDRAAGHDILDWRHMSIAEGGGPFKCSYPPNDADMLEEYIMQAITPYYGPSKVSPSKFTPDFSVNMRNSTLGDIFDIYLGTTLTPGKEPTYAQLSKYPVVFIMHDLQWNMRIANAIKRYVADGGTLVLTSAQAAPFADDASFLGLSMTGEKAEADNLHIDKVALSGAKVIESVSSGLPLVTVNRFHGGNVVFVTSPFFRQIANRDTVPTALMRLLERLQRETLPVHVDGLCEAMYNICPDGSWRVVLINNSGVQKDPSTSDDPSRPEFAAKLRVRMPVAARAVETRKCAKMVRTEEGGEAVYSVTVPAGEIYILKVDGLKGLTPCDFAKTAVAGVTPFETKPYVANIPNDGYTYGMPDLTCGGIKPPEVIGEWRAENGMKDSSGNGHDMTFNNGAYVKDGKFISGKPTTFGRVYFQCNYPIFEATYDMYVTPEKDVRKGGVFLKDSQCGVSDLFGIGIDEGKWKLFCYDEHGRRVSLYGPAVEPRRTRLTLTFKAGFLRLYVDGVECIDSVNGPLKTAVSRDCRDNFYRQVILVFGASSKTGKDDYFKGECESLKFLSTAIVP